MKITDYAPRSAAMDSYLKGKDLAGVEVGCDVGSHSEALLRYCSIAHLVVIDLWENDYCRGYCMGRLQSQGWKNYVEFMKKDSHAASLDLPNNTYDFVYIDIVHDTKSVALSLDDWWPKLKVNGILGYRNYSIPTVQQAVDDFIADRKLRTQYERYHNEMILFKDQI